MKLNISLLAELHIILFRMGIDKLDLVPIRRHIKVKVCVLAFISILDKITINSQINSN